MYKKEDKINGEPQTPGVSLIDLNKRGRLTTLRVSKEAEKGDIFITLGNHDPRRNEAKNHILEVIFK